MRTGRIGNIASDGVIEKEFYCQGYIYKDFDAFENKTNEICYVPEYSGDNIEDTVSVREDNKYTYKDFVRIAQEFIDMNEDVKRYCEKNGETAEDIARNVFEMVDWQHPETLIDEFENNGCYIEEDEV